MEVISSPEQLQNESSSKDAFVQVLNIPKKFKIADLRTFFSDFIEREKFKIFHYLRSPETRGEETLETHKCLVQLKNSRDLKEFITRYNNKLWIDKTGQKLDSMCVLEVSKEPNNNISDNNKPQSNISEVPLASAKPSKYLSIRERKKLTEEQKKNSSANTVNMELIAPAGLPNGNIGTSRREIQRSVDKLILPSSVLKSLGIQRKALSENKFGAVPLDYRGLKTPQGYATIDYVDSPMDYYKEVNNRGANRKRKHADIEDNFIQHDDSGDSSGEEWDRYQAIHENDEEKEYLYEEQLEKTWDKGGSGLVQYTDAVHWDQLKGDVDEQDVDDWDMKLGAKREPRTSDNQTARRPRKQFKFKSTASRINSAPTNHASTNQATAGLSVESISNSMSVPPGLGETMVESSAQSNAQPTLTGDIGAFERHTTGAASKIMTKMGWSYGRGIGPLGREGISEPIQLDVNTATYGLGYQPATPAHKKSNQNQPTLATIYDQNYYRPNYVSNPVRDAVSYRNVNGVKMKVISFEQGEVIDANGTIVNKKRDLNSDADPPNIIEALSVYNDLDPE